MATKTIMTCKIHGLAEHLLSSRGSNRSKAYRCVTCHNQRRNANKRAAKLKAIEYKGGQCMCCGYNKCVEALEFHHLNPLEKEFEISARRSWEALTAELDKCILVCANCHREFHSETR